MARSMTIKPLLHSTAILFAILAVSGCGHHRDAMKYPDRHPDGFVTQKPDRPYDEIGHYRRNSNDPEAVIEWARDQARMDEADAYIIDMNAATYTDTSVLWGTSSGGTTAMVTTIRWKNRNVHPPE